MQTEKQTVNSAFQYCDQLVHDFEKVIAQPIVKKSSVYYTGIDLGTAFIVLAVLDENYQPVAGAYRFANVVKDGMVVDYIGAIHGLYGRISLPMLLL